MRTTGNDGSAGTSAGAAWLTIGKALGAAGIASGDTVYIGAGTYREAVTVNMTSATAETFVIGDVDGSQTGDVGDVILTVYTTNDTTAPAATPTMTINGRDFLTFKKILFIGGDSSPSCISATATNSVNITFQECAFITARTNSNLISYTGLADVASNWIVDRCMLLGSTSGSGFSIILPTSAVADYDSVFLIQNCSFFGAISLGINVTASGAASFKGGGVDVFNCTFAIRQAYSTGTNISTSIPCTIYNSFMIGGAGTGLAAATSGQLVEDYNRISGVTPRSNVTAGSNSISDTSHALLLHFGYELIAGALLRPFGMPMASSPLLGRGNQAGGPTVDILNRPRPAGGASTSYAWGAYERHDTAVRETSVVDAGSNAIKITGPGDHDFLIPVDATSTTITVRARYDTNHATTNKPQATILNGEAIGVTTETKTMTAAVDTWETITFSAISPTAKGFITLRLISRSAAGNGIAYFDTVSY